MASLLFTGKSFFAGFTSSNQTADLESSTIVLGTALPGVKTLFVSDPVNAPYYSGNNVRGTLYAVDANNQVVASYYGEISRQYKAGSATVALQMYLYPTGTTQTGTPSQTIFVDVYNDTFSFSSGQTVKTSSDPVAATLNSMLPAPPKVVMTSDTSVAYEAGGVLNGTIATNADATGNVLGNDVSGGAVSYKIDTTVSPMMMVVDTSGSGIVLSQISNASAGTNSVVAAGTTSTSGVTLNGVYGTLTIGADGSYVYKVNNSHTAVEALRQSTDTLNDTFTYTITDSRGNKAISQLTVTVKGANDAPVAHDDYNFAKESLEPTSATQYSATDPLGTKATGNVLPNDTDVDQYGETKSILNVFATATAKTVGPTTLSFSASTSLSNIKAGFYVFTVSATGTFVPLLNSAGVPITVATISGTNISLSSDVSLPSSGTIHFAAKADGSGTGDTVTYTGSAASSGTAASTISVIDGYIAVGMTVTGTGVTAGTTVTGVTYDATGKVTDFTLSQTASIAAGTTLSFTAQPGVQLTGEYGTLTLNGDGSYVYTPTPNNPNLAAGQSVVDEFRYRMKDASGATSDATLYITVVGSAPSDPNGVADVAAATESGGTLNTTAGTNPTGNLLSNDTTPAGTKTVAGIKSDQVAVETALATGSVTSPAGAAYDAKVSGVYGDLFIKADGTYQYIVKNNLAAIEGLKSGQSVTDTFQYKLSNGSGIDWSSITVTVSGVYDAPVAVADTQLAVANQFDPTGNVLSNDTDVDLADTKQVTKVVAGTGALPGTDNVTGGTSTTGYTTVVGTYGSLHIGADGSYVYLVDNANPAVIALAPGVTVNEVFTYQVKDAGGLTSSTTLTLAVQGANDAPVNTLPTSTVAVQNGTALPLTGGNLVSVNDPDNNISAVTISVISGSLSLSTVGSTSTGSMETLVTTLASGAQVYGTATGSEIGTSSITLYGTQDQINAALASLSYTPATGFTGNDTFSISTIDAYGLKDTDSFTLAVAAPKNVTVSSPTVNEASPYAVFTVAGTAGQLVSLAFQNDSNPATVDATLGTDAGTQLQYFDGSNWVNYTGGTVALPSSGQLLVRNAVNNDAVYEGAETYQLAVTPVGGNVATGTATIVDDGTGSIYPNTTTGATDPTAALDDDRPLQIDNISVNEASPYAVFTITAVAGQALSLSLKNDADATTKDATLGGDAGTQLQYFDGANWINYTGGQVNVPANGTLLVRTAVINDGVYEGAETFQLTAAPTGGNAVTGTATILDDGTGNIYPNNNTGNPDPAALKDDDRGVSVNSIEVNEASPYAVFTVMATAGQSVSLALQNDSNAATRDATLGIDAGIALQYFDGTSWVNYTGGQVTVPAGGKLLVRTTVSQDAAYEGAETFNLAVTPQGGTTAQGTATILDDGTGNIYPNNNTGNPDVNALKDDDRAVQVDNILVNEASPYAVFTVKGSVGQGVNLSLQNDVDPTTADATLGLDAGTHLQYFNGLGWADYTGGSVAIPTGGVLLVRTTVSNDSTYEGAETLQLKVDPAGGTAVYGTATIVDDGTGSVYPDNTTGNSDPNAVLDDDRAIKINDIDVNERSPYGVFTITAAAGQLLTLGLQNDVDPNTANATLGVDTGVQLQYYNGSSWVNYVAGTSVAVPAGGTMMVRLSISNGPDYEGPETFQLSASTTSGLKVYGTATIWDDGTGTIFNFDGTPNQALAKDDDRTVKVSDILVNEASPYAVFTVTGAAGLKVTLGTQNDADLATSDALIGTDTGTGLEYFDGTVWQKYVPGASVTLPASGQLLVRTPVINDTLSEGAETMQLVVTPPSGTPSYGTATILDDGTGNIYPDNTTGATDPAAIKDDDRPITVSSVEVNEASPFAVFTVTATAGRLLSLKTSDGTATSVDYGSALEYSLDNGLTWQSYSSGTVATPASGGLLVRVPVKQDDLPEGKETFTLSVTGGSQTQSGTGTIRDDGLGAIFKADGTLDLTAVKDDDRPLAVNNIEVNEGSPFAVFSVTGEAGQLVNLSLQNDSNPATTDATLGTDAGVKLEYFDGSKWVVYTSGNVAVPASGELLVRTPVTNDAVYEGAETFQLKVASTGGAAVFGTATVLDDGTGNIYPDNTTGNPDPNAVPNDDRAVQVNDIAVNEGSPYAVFSVTGKAGQTVTLGLQSDADPTTADATLGTDAGVKLEYFDGSKWVAYTGGTVAVPASGELLVRTPVTNDAVYEGAETFQLKVMPTGGVASYGTATILDDGTGVIYPDNTTGNPDPNAVPNDDRAVQVNDIAVNEGSPFAVFSVTGKAGQAVSLSLQNDKDPATANATLGTDTGVQLQYFDGTQWVNYVGGTLKLPASGELLVRTAVNNDAVYEGAETFQLAVTPTGGVVSYGTATILDDGTGAIYPDNTTGNPDPNAVLNDDRAVQVNDIAVNEGSPFAVFSVTGKAGQAVSLSLQNDNDPATADAMLGTDAGVKLEYFDGSKWVAYTGGTVAVPASGELLVRTPVTNDTVYEGAETFQLAVTPTGGMASYGTATILDDGTGAIYPDNTTGNPDPNAVPNDDRAVQVNDIAVNEGSPYAVFSVTGKAGQTVTLGLQSDADPTTADATLGTDAGVKLEYFDGSKWVAYTGGTVALPASGELLVRTPVTNDAVYEGAETFQLKVMPTGGVASYGTATILDDGTGAIYPDNTTGNPDLNAVPNDDRAVQVNDIAVNEGSPFAVFSVTGKAGQAVSLSLQSDNDPLTADATLGTDAGVALEYFDGVKWVAYTGGTVALPASGELLVRTPVTNDAVYEGAETFQLKVAPTGGVASYGTATILDDGTGAIYPDNTTGNPDPNAVPNDDRAVQVNNIAVNEGSPFAVFSVTGKAGQAVSLSLQNDNDPLTADATLGTDAGVALEYFDGVKWVAYTGGTVALPASGELLVRTPVTNDTVYEGAETFQLAVTPTGGVTSYGTATILDDGTGAIYPDNTTGNPDPNAVPNDDRAVQVSSPQVNEASPFAVFTVNGKPGQPVSLSLQNDEDPLTADATLGTDAGVALEYFDGVKWVAYTGGTVALPASGELLVRTPVTNDAVYEGAETFQLKVAPAGGVASYGTATILDDGTGAIYPDNTTGNPDLNAVPNDDRAVQVNNVDVNEASPFAVFTVSGKAGQQVCLSLQNDEKPSTADATLGSDVGVALEYFDGAKWVPYTGGTVALPASGELLVRTPVTNDAVYEGAETFQLKVMPTGGVASYGTATILDDGTGAIYPDNTTGNPDPNAVPNDDRAVQVSSPEVNEASPFAVFTVSGKAGQAVSLSLQNDNDPLTADATLGADAGVKLEYFDGSKWMAYTGGTVALPASGQLLVRTPVTNDTVYEGPETFQLKVSPTGGVASYGTATITDDGTGNIYPDNTTGNPDPNAARDDDRAVQVNSIDVNEGSPYAVFTVKAQPGQALSLALQDDNDLLTADAALGADTATQLQYFDGSKWVNYSAGAVTTPASGNLLVRVAINNDAVYEGTEAFLLKVANASGVASYGTGTIHDDGTGVVFNDQGNIDTGAAKNDDRPVLVVPQPVPPVVTLPAPVPEAKPPVINGLFETSIPEGTRPVTQLSAGEPVTWSLAQANDAVFFQIDANGRLKFALPPDYEKPLDQGADNTYILTVKATNSAGLSTLQQITVHVTDVSAGLPIYYSDTTVATDRVLSTSPAKATESSQVQFFATARTDAQSVALKAWFNPLTGDWFYGVEGVAAPYDCYVERPDVVLGRVLKKDQGSFNVHTYLNAQGNTQIVSETAAENMGLLDKGYRDLGVSYQFASSDESVELVGMVNLSQLG